MSDMDSQENDDGNNANDENDDEDENENDDDENDDDDNANENDGNPLEDFQKLLIIRRLASLQKRLSEEINIEDFEDFVNVENPDKPINHQDIFAKIVRKESTKNNEYGQDYW